jgi:hypothetical protein
VTEKILAGKKDILEKLVAVLLERETIEQDEFNEIIGGVNPNTNSGRNSTQSKSEPVSGFALQP